MAAEKMAIDKDAISELVYTSCLHMNDGEFETWLNDLCAPEFRYTITNYSDELRRQQTWLDFDRDDMVRICTTVHEHVHYPGRFHRQANLYRIDFDADGKHANAVSGVVVVHTDLDGVSSFYAAGTYRDRIDVSGAAPLMIAREVRLDTRVLKFGSHWPV